MNQLAEPFGISQQAISKHLAYLERARLIDKRKVGRESVCTLRPGPMEAVFDWVAAYREYWNQSFDKLNDLLRNLEARKPR